MYYTYKLVAGPWHYIGHAKRSYNRLHYHRRDIEIGLIERQKNIKPRGKDPAIWSEALSQYPEPLMWTMEIVTHDIQSKEEALREEEKLIAAAIDDRHCLNNAIGQKSGRYASDRLSKSLQGSKKPDHWKQAMAGSGNPFYGKTQTLEARAKMSATKAAKRYAKKFFEWLEHSDG
jgi:predicted secreted protein